MKKIIYITGCLGFIGSYVTRACLKKNWYVRGVDKCTYAANEKLLEEFSSYENFVFEKKDINNIAFLHDCDFVIILAAETHVDNSIYNDMVVGGDQFIQTNIKGFHNLLNAIRKKSQNNKPTLLHFSTDEVYGDIVGGSYNENSPLKPSNPYSATKAAADMLIFAWSRTYEVPYIIVRPTNNYGVGQYVEKLVARCCKNLSIGKKIPVHNQGEPIRNWLNAKDTAEAIVTIIEKGETENIYNISGNYEDKNINVVKKIIYEFFKSAPHSGDAHWPDETGIDYLDYIDFGCSRAGQDVRYAVDDSKLRNLGWSPKCDFDEEIKEIVNFYKNNFIW